MDRLFQPLRFVLVRYSRNELIRQIEFLRAENQMLRKRVSKFRIRLDHDERTRLIKLGQAVGPGLHKLIAIIVKLVFLHCIIAQRRVQNCTFIFRPARIAVSIDRIRNVAHQGRSTPRIGVDRSG